MRGRKEEPKKKGVFQVLDLNFEARDYFSVTDQREVYEPPLAKSMSESEVFEAFVTHLASPPKYPCHTQTVERHINFMTQTSKHVLETREEMGMLEYRSNQDSLWPHITQRKTTNHKQAKRMPEQS